ncbi:hypothetical protein SO802_012954 [Lithocarpus litseifolius]|uniref:Reverse transcriptase domain-containing protein n=1 Tax=Lithocarpus litseifolius TaxID=425828 RepID=A0AAW2D6V1_9ROSI
MANCPSHSLVVLEKELHRELECILNQEEELWVQKSRITRLVEGDRNTTFLHMTTIVRRRRNRISSIQNEMGKWILSEYGAMDYIKGGFVKLFTSSFTQSSLTTPQPSRWQAALSEEENLSLYSPVSDEEIKHELWSIKAFKALGPDGLHAGFFQRFWMIVGESVQNEVKKIFKDTKVPKYLNRTNIVLIPKIAGPETLGNYLPISLCNIVYKIVSKMIVARLRPLLDKLVSPLQSTFVPGRRSVDNAMVVQELIHSIGNNKGKVGYMTIKMDLEKAYDKLEWSFIRDVLVNANLPHNLVTLIMSCVSSMSTSILFNGGNVDPIFPSHGIRQGDPLSPYLFILCMEVLGHLIEEKCEARSWNPIKSSKSRATFSHLFFADDLVLFARADYNNCSAIRDVFDVFCVQSGQTINESKSRVFFSPNVNIDTRESLCDILGFSSTPNLGRYLGFPIKHRGANKLGARNKDKLPCSRTWKAMKMGMEVFKKGIRWIPGKNSELSLWDDNWASNGPLQSLIQGPIEAEEEHLKVRDMLRNDGWDWSDISLQIPEEVLMEIRSIPYSMTAPNEDDRLVWNGENKGDFDLKSAYNLAIGSMDGGDKFTGRWIWKSETLPRIKTFLWQCMHYSIGVVECLVRRCLSESDVCPMCNRKPETILRDCSFSRDTWFKLGINPSSNFYESNLQNWLETNCKDGSHKDRSAQSNIHHDKHLDSKTVVRVRREKPQVGWVRLNTDGSAIGNPGRAGGGGILLDDQGRWIEIDFSDSPSADRLCSDSCADFLAKMGSVQIREFILFNDPPVDLEELISLDAVGMYHNRLLSELSLSP